MQESRRPKITLNGSPDSNGASSPERSSTTPVGWYSKPALQRCFVSIYSALAFANTIKTLDISSSHEYEGVILKSRF